ncbi:hypothetical protein MSKU3_3304 [Komagataeibacter oboediens]|nr:hypothetical protein MSKU3_3304 [Komagataeibacter oboediens]
MRQSCPTRPFSTILMPFQNIDRHDCFIVQQERHLGQDIMQAAALWNAHGPALFLRRGTIEMLESALQALLPAGTQERWTRLFGQFLGLNKLYPVVVMPPF